MRVNINPPGLNTNILPTVYHQNGNKIGINEDGELIINSKKEVCVVNKESSFYKEMLERIEQDLCTMRDNENDKPELEIIEASLAKVQTWRKAIAPNSNISSSSAINAATPRDEIKPSAPHNTAPSSQAGPLLGNS